MNRAFACAAAVGAVLGLFAEAPDAASAREVAVARGARFLLSQQCDDGHWSDPHVPALTALPVWALSCSGTDVGDVIDKGVAFVLSTQRDDGGFYVPKPGRGGGGLGNYNTSVCLSALFESGRAPVQAMLNARQFLASSQLTGDDNVAGGFGYERVSRRRYADLSNTAYAVDAMRRTEAIEELRAGRRADLDWGAAVAFVENLQANDPADRADRGGAAYNARTTPGRGLRAYGSMSYAAVLSMCCARLSRADPRVRSTLEYCARHWTVDENPGMGAQGFYYYCDILARALAAAEVDTLQAEDGRTIDWKRELADRLVGLQREDGSWVNDNNRFWEADPVLCTSFALLALELCR